MSAPFEEPFDETPHAVNAASRWRTARQRAVAAETRLLAMAGLPPRRAVPLSEVAHVQRLHSEAVKLLCTAIEESLDTAAVVILAGRVSAVLAEAGPLADR